jgi:ferric-dicitrate binding protein FerR (iron transport regulator)
MRKKDKLYELLAKELNSTLSPEEKALLNDSLANNEPENEQVNALRDFWNKAYPQHFSHTITARTEKKLGLTYRTNSFTRSQFVYKIAASVLLLLSLGLSGLLFLKDHNSPSLMEYHSNTREVKQFELSDGTKIWLNGGSYILAVEPFSGESRNVKLYGEAYFEVAPNAEMPFIVETRHLTTKVLGTAFNISSWPDSKVQQIELYEGKVKLEADENWENEIVLTPGQRARFNAENGDFQIGEHGKSTAAAWRNGILNFYNEELFSIVLQLEKKFETRVLVSDSEAGKLRFTAEFSDEPLEKILLLLSEAKAFKYNITEQGVLIQSVN